MCLPRDVMFLSGISITKVTPEKAKAIAAAENSGFVAEEDVDRDSIGV